MNDKIESLVKQTGGRIKEVCHGHGDYDQEFQLSNLSIDTFAALIIKECMNINNEFVGHRIGEIDLDVVYKERFGLTL